MHLRATPHLSASTRSGAGAFRHQLIAAAHKEFAMSLSFSLSDLSVPISERSHRVQRQGEKKKGSSATLKIRV